jgi:hypothetical protein
MPDRSPAFLVTDPNTKPKLSAAHLYDARSAMQRALADYFETLELQPPFDNRNYPKLRKVVAGWAEPNELSDYPAAAVYGVGAGEYDNAGHPWWREENRLTDELLVIETGELVQNYVVEVWCNDPAERYAFASAAEAASWPVDWMCGIRLMMPFYHGLPTEFEFVSIDYIDTEPDDSRRYRKIRLTYKGHCVVARVVKFSGMMEARTAGTVGGAD